MTKPYNSGDKVQVKEARQKAAALGDRFAKGMQKITNDPECRFVLKAFLDIAKPMSDTYMRESRDHAHAAGWAGAGWWWMQNALLHDPHFIGKLQTDDGLPTLESQNDDGHNDTNSDDSNNG